MIVSLNEVAATAKKSARGVGYSWGMAEEAAMATRWLCANGIDGCGSLAALLRRSDSVDLTDMATTAGTPEWSAPSGALCPIQAGTALSDFAKRLMQTDIQMVNVVEPILVLPFAASAARQLGVIINITWSGLNAATDGTNISWTKDHDPIAHTTTDKITIGVGDTIGPTAPHQTRATPSDADWDWLQQLAARTYAPATEESRVLGAGVGISDRD